MKIHNFYFLDRNVIITIGYLLNNPSLECKTIAIRKKRLKAIDKKKNFVSGLLSIIEGANSYSETPYDKTKTVFKESEVINSFFKSAQTDSKTNIKLADQIAAVGLGKHEEKYDNYFSFYDDVSPILSQTISAIKYEKIKNIIIDKAISHSITPLHPVVLCSLAVLYGNNQAREVLKFKSKPNNRNTYNALSDILSISRIPVLSTVLKEGKFKDCKIKLVTFDKSLKEIYDKFIAKNSKVNVYNNQSVTINVDFTFDPSLFPNLPPEKIFSLLDDLKKLDKI